MAVITGDSVTNAGRAPLPGSSRVTFALILQM